MRGGGREKVWIVAEVGIGGGQVGYPRYLGSRLVKTDAPHRAVTPPPQCQRQTRTGIAVTWKRSLVADDNYGKICDFRSSHV